MNMFLFGVMAGAASIAYFANPKFKELADKGIKQAKEMLEKQHQPKQEECKDEE